MKKLICIQILVLFSLLVISCTSGDGSGSIVSPDNRTAEKFTKRYNVDQTFYSEKLKQEVKYNVLLPTEYLTNSDAQYDVVYLFHGYGDNQSAWGSSLNIQLISDEQERLGHVRPLIYIMPQGFNSYYCNSYDGSFDYMDMLINEIVPLIDKRFRTNAASSSRAVVGYSMGGFGALTVAMQHPEVFSVSLGLSPSLNTERQYSMLSQDGFDIQWGSVFGGKGMSGNARINSYYQSQCPLNLVTGKSASLGSVRFYIDCGDDEERLYAGNGELHNLMRDKQVAHEYRVRNGAHTSNYWIQSMSEGLCFIEKSFQNMAYPEESLHTFGGLSHAVNKIVTVSGQSLELYFPRDYDANKKYYVLYYSKGGGNAAIATQDVAEALDSLMDIRKIVIAGFDVKKMKNNGVALTDIINAVEKNVNTDGTPNSRLGLAYGSDADYLCAESLGADAFLKNLFFEDADVSNIRKYNMSACYLDLTDGGTNYQSMYDLFCKLRDESVKVEYRIRNGKDTQRSAQTGIYTLIPFMAQLTKNE